MNIGIMDILSKHLSLISKIFNDDSARWQQVCETFKQLDLSYDPARHREMCEKGSVDLRNQGNKHFKAGRFPEARLLYTQSIAASVSDAPLSSVAFSNRYLL